ncbi:MAG TPA: hypothetical protein VLM20_03200, partial [Methylophilaceae bacterium]|nr:hypothetical protein [Methylophilaceae bacterium]
MLATRAATILVFIWMISGISNSLAASQTTVAFNSKPEGAAVCKKVLKRETCIGTTPMQLDVGFINSHESKKFKIYKIGYEPFTAKITSDTHHVSIVLNKQDLFPNPAQIENAKLKSLQTAINTQTSSIIYNTNHGNDH